MTPDSDIRDGGPAGDDREADREPREYGHSSGDRNTKAKEGEFKPLQGGEQRDEDPEPAA